MFWDRWIPQKYFVKSEVCVAEICVTAQETFYNYALLHNKSGKLELTDTGVCRGELKLPARVEKNKISLILIINGTGVLMRKIGLSESELNNPEELIKKHLPAINHSEFFIQLYPQENGTAHLAFCRRNMVQSEIKSLQDKKYDLAAVYIGAPVVSGLKPLWNNFNKLPGSLYTAELSNNSIENLVPNNETKNGETITFDNIQVPASHTPCFAAGFAYLTQNKIVWQENNVLQAITEAHTEKNKFRFLMVVVVALAFFMAVINVVFYTTYFDKHNRLESELSVYQGKYEKINQLLTKYQKNKSLIENAGVLNKNRLSEFADRIAITIPESVVLSELHFNPKVENDDSADSLIIFKSGVIVLKGNCEKSMVVNEWLNVLKMQKFAGDVSLERFIYNKDGLQPNFEIKIVTRQ